ncbi:MAG: leucine-rich repeat protein [Ruminococcus callidus]
MFYRCTSLNDVKFGANVNSIGASAFYGCTSLTEVNIPDTVTKLGQSALQSAPMLPKSLFRTL